MIGQSTEMVGMHPDGIISIHATVVHCALEETREKQSPNKY